MEFERHNEGRGVVELSNQLSITKPAAQLEPVSSSGTTADKVRHSRVKSEGEGEGCSASLGEPRNSIAAVFNHFLISGMSGGC